MPYTTENHSFFKTIATLVDDHNSSDARREGTILRMKGEGSVIHWDEGYYAIEGVNYYNGIINKLHSDFRAGKIILILDGFKLKGKFQLNSVGKGNWVLEKINDEYDELNYRLYNDLSVITKFDINYYQDLFLEQKKKMQYLNEPEAIKFSLQNEGVSFTYKKTSLPERTHKILNN